MATCRLVSRRRASAPACPRGWAPAARREAARRCRTGEISARLVINKPEDEERSRAMGIADPKRVYTSKDLASGDGIIFAATGVTDGSLMRGVRFLGDGTRTSSIVMQSDPPR